MQNRQQLIGFQYKTAVYMFEFDGHKFLSFNNIDMYTLTI